MTKNFTSSFENNPDARIAKSAIKKPSIIGAQFEKFDKIKRIMSEQKEYIENNNLRFRAPKYNQKKYSQMNMFQINNEIKKQEENLRKIQNVNSAEVIDMRRAFG